MMNKADANVVFIFLFNTFKVLMGWNRNSIHKDSIMFPIETMLNQFRVVLRVQLIIQ